MGSKVYVTGLAETRKYLRTFAPELVPVMRDELKTIVNTTTVPAIKSKMPARTGKARSSVRAVSSGNLILVAAGGARVPYFGWLDWGGEIRGAGRGRNLVISRPRSRSGRYIYPGIASTNMQLVESVGKAVDQMINRVI